MTASPRHNRATLRESLLQMLYDRGSLGRGLNPVSVVDLAMHLEVSGHEVQVVCRMLEEDGLIERSQVNAWLTASGRRHVEKVVGQSATESNQGSHLVVHGNVGQIAMGDYSSQTYSEASSGASIGELVELLKALDASKLFERAQQVEAFESDIAELDAANSEENPNPQRIRRALMSLGYQLSVSASGSALANHAKTVVEGISGILSGIS